MEIKFFADPSHGWGEVPISLIKELCIEDQISDYSYMNGNMVYLEEDLDLSVFLRALESRGMGYPKFIEIHTNHDSKVRSYRRFNYASC
jgi:hypothetical protein